MPRLGDIGEIAAIRELLGLSGAPGGAKSTAGVVIGPGDDAAVLRPSAGRELVATTDAMVDGVHFLREWIGAEALGARLAEANLSDLAATAAAARWALVSMGVSAEHDLEDLRSIQRGIVAALGRAQAVVAGGNLTAVAGPEWFSLVLLGEVETGAAWTRSGARAGDLVAVTGFPGRAGAGARLALERPSEARAPRFAPLLAAWIEPRARLALARELARAGGVTAAIDLSDGFAGDLDRVCEASGVGARLEAARWPEDALLAEAAAALGVPAEALSLGASDDYELLLAIDPDRVDGCREVASRLGAPLAVVGTFGGPPGERSWVGWQSMDRARGAAGYDHFRVGKLPDD